MGNPHQGGARDAGRAADIRCFFSSRSWIDGRAIEQLEIAAQLPGVRTVAAFPDLHPGKFGPVGCAILADRIHPHLIGNDIGCGMSLFVLDIPARKLNAEKAAERLRALEGPWDGDTGPLLEEAGLAPDLHSRALGTIGGGNHFCELQTVNGIVDGDGASLAGFDRHAALLLVHSGSRSLGAAVFERVQHDATGFAAGSAEGQAYFARHDEAVRWAALNRRIIAMRAARALRSECRLAVDAPHNLVQKWGGLFLHRKGAAKADMPLVPLAGSRSAVSYLLKPGRNIENSLETLAHGAGRKYDRRSMHGRVGASRSERDQLLRNAYGGRVVCDDRQLLVEEAPGAYKDPHVAVADLADNNLASIVAMFRPLVTFKKAIEAEDAGPAHRGRRS